jgi:D-sedoheptulose 7-phosphate isomerase
VLRPDGGAPAAESVPAAFARRDRAAAALDGAAEALVAACGDLAGRFRRGGKLIVFGNGGSGADASHVAVEFMHPVTVGARALPALALGNDMTTVTGVGARDGFGEVFAHQLRHLAEPADIALGVTPDGQCPNVRRGLAAATGLGLLTVVLSGGRSAGAPAADHVIHIPCADPLVVKETHVTAYHLMWELVHILLERTRTEPDS